MMMTFTKHDVNTGKTLKALTLTTNEATQLYWNNVNHGYPMLTYEDDMKKWLTEHIFDNDDPIFEDEDDDDDNEEYTIFESFKDPIKTFTTLEITTK